MKNTDAFVPVIITVRKKKVFISPAWILVLAWLSVSLLYITYLSPRLYFPVEQVLAVSLAVIIPAILSHYFVIVLRKVMGGHNSTIVIKLSDVELKRIKIIFYVLVALSLLEFAVYGYIPLISKIRGANVSHFDFGIPSVHGLLMAGFLSLSTISIVLYQNTKKKIFLYIILYTFIWAVLIVSRKIFMVGVAQWVFVYLALNKVNILKFLRVFFIGFLVIIIFGVVGDIRSGAGHIDELGGFQKGSLIEMVPGLSWVYLYVTTPLHNLIFVTQNTPPEYNLFYSRTFSSLIPSIITDIISGDVNRHDFDVASSNVGVFFESEAFNVSTAMVPPYIDNGWLGIVILMIFLGLISGSIYSSGRGSLAFFSLITISTACLLSIYSDNFTNLNFIGQFIFYFFIFLKFRINGKLLFG